MKHKQKTMKLVNFFIDKNDEYKNNDLEFKIKGETKIDFNDCE